MRRRVALGIAAALTVGAAAATAIVSGLTDAEGSTAGDAMPPATARVTRETLVDTQTHSGDLGYGEDDRARRPGRRDDDHAGSGGCHGGPRQGALPDRRRPGGAALRQAAGVPDAGAGRGRPGRHPVREEPAGAGLRRVHRRSTSTPRRPPARSASGRTTSASRRPAPSTRRRWSTRPARCGSTATPPRPATWCSPARNCCGPPARPGSPRSSWRSTTSGWPRSARRCEVTLPDGSTTPAKITAAETVVAPAEGQGEEDTTKVEVTVAFPAGQAPKGLDQASVDVAFTVAERPERADRAGGGVAGAGRGRLRRRGGGRYDHPDRRRRDRACSPSGQVEVSGGGHRRGHRRGGAVMTAVVELGPGQQGVPGRGDRAATTSACGSATASWSRSSARPAPASPPCCT